MFEYYCPKCKKTCEFNEEIELREANYEGDWQEFHLECDSKVVLTLKHNN